VADYSQQKIYQLKPDSGEVRAIVTHCHPDTVAFDPSTDVLYMTCAQYVENRMHYHIRKKTFNGIIDEAIYMYYAPQGQKQRYVYTL